MLDFTGIKCPVCEIPFQEDDDIVVCPVCGAPYHRDCYETEGHCIFESEHASGKVWSPPKDPNAAVYEIKDKECPVCGVLNAHSSLICTQCSAPLTEASPIQNKNNAAGIPKSPQINAFGGHISTFIPDPMGGVSPTEILAENVTFGDASKLVRQNSGYYLPVFRYIKTTGRNKFNFTAFMFSGPWMLFRKQYKHGIPVTLLMFALYMGYVFSNLFISYPTIVQLLNDIGADSTSIAAISQEQYLQMTEILMKSPSLYFKMALSTIFAVSMLVVMIVVGVRGNRMYMNHCIQTVQGIRSSGDTENVNAAIEEKSGVNVYIAICLFISYMIISNIPRIFS